MRRFGRSDTRFRRLTLAAALLVLAIFVGIIVSLAIGAWPAFQHLRLRLLLITEVWNPVTEKFGALAPIYGTLVTSALAMLVAVPVGIGIAIFLTEICPRPLQAADRHRHRTSGRHSQHHLRHLGPVRLRALFPGAYRSPG